jgi:RNA polymerase sigma-70 factor (ECF subfamily)
VQQISNQLRIDTISPLDISLFIRKKIYFNENDFDSVIAACLSNDSLAQRALFQQFYGYAKSICLRYTADKVEAEEILNEGFLKVFQNLDKYDPAQSFKAWLRTILVNTAISNYRKNKKFQDNINIDDIHEIGFEDSVLEQISADEILQIVQQLPPIYRTIFVMYVVDGYSHREIADALNLNESTVRSNFSRARAKLQVMIRLSHPYLFPQDWDTAIIKYNEN